MDVAGLSDRVTLAMGQTQSALQTSVQRLSSGLRVSSAIDDPSGLAISEKQKAQVNGLDQGSQSLQDANNALNVADGALSNIDNCLQRMRTLVVQANSTILSSSETEINQLSQEINTISQHATFNGKQLLDGSLSSQKAQGGQLLVATNGTLNDGGDLVLTGPGEAPVLEDPNEQFQEEVSVDGIDPIPDQTNPIDPTVYDVSTELSGDATFGPEQSNADQTEIDPYRSGFEVAATPASLRNGPIPLTGSPPDPSTGQYSETEYDQTGTNPILGWDIGDIQPTDVGASAFMFTIPPQTKAAGAAVQVNVGDAEGDIVPVDIPAINTQNLAVNEVQLGDNLTNTANLYRID